MAIEFTAAQVEFLQAPRHAILATNRAGKSPQISPVWYWFESGVFFVSMRDDTAKYHNLRRDPNTSLIVDGGRSDPRYVIVHGVAELFPNSHPIQNSVRKQIVDFYIHDRSEAQEYFESTDDGHPVLMRLDPERVLTYKFD